jgi:hypothetical protein
LESELIKTKNQIENLFRIYKYCLFEIIRQLKNFLNIYNIRHPGKSL